ncbi:serpin family protein [Embleya sp. AB8]|uniref:serpin family protein n=1 Tax=Embleya sp. AB8 TaxID=3156304 RepID=UPI003C73E853
MEPALREHAGTVRELASRWLDSMLSDPGVRAAGGDVVCSPTGLWLALAAVATGAEGDTAEELADLVGVAWRESAPVVTAVARELADTEALAVATGVWSAMPLDAGFRAALPDLGFGSLGDRPALDAWVARATDGLIDRIPVVVDASTRVVLVTALALRARWRTQFAAAETHDAQFRAADGTRGPVPTMRREVPAGDVWTIAGRDGEVTVVELPCVGEQSARVRFALGPEQAPPASVITAAWAPRDTGKAYAGEDVELRLPRFELRTRLDVLPHLRDLGVTLAGTDAADFRGMTDEPVRIDAVVQESLLRIAEEGVEAASVTATSMTLASFRSRPTRRVSFDRPFACVVMDASGYVPLFAAYQATRPAYRG